jgi:hypothetical protein
MSGTWTLKMEHSSNFREFFNLVNALEEAANSGILNDSEIFMFTDNSTAEHCFSMEIPWLNSCLIWWFG